ncbi:hypothetical protein DRN67_01725, partial [Candidatus Micrarchaeota archaeon]
MPREATRPAPTQRRDDSAKVQNVLDQIQEYFSAPESREAFFNFLKTKYGSDLTNEQRAGQLTLDDRYFMPRENTMSWNTLLRDYQLYNVEKLQQDFFMVEDCLAQLYEQHTGTPIAENLSEAQRRTELANFWVGQYAEPINNKLNAEIEGEPWKFNSQEYLLAGLSMQNYMANNEEIVNQLTTVVASDKQYYDYIARLAGPVAQNWGQWSTTDEAARNATARNASQWYLSCMGGMFGETRETTREILNANIFNRRQIYDLGNRGLSYTDLGMLMLNAESISPQDLTFTSELIVNPVPNIQTLDNQDLVVGTAGFRKLIGNVMGSTIATAGIAHLTAKATENEEQISYVQQTWSSITNQLLNLQSGQADLTISKAILTNIDRQYHALYGIAQMQEVERATEVQHPTMRFEAEQGQFLSSSQIASASDQYYFNQALAPYLAQIDAQVEEQGLEAFVNDEPGMHQMIQRELEAANLGVRYENGKFDLSAMSAEDQQRLKLIIARIFMDTDLAFNRVTAVTFESETGNVVWEAMAGAEFQLGTERNFVNMMHLFGANRLEETTTASLKESGEVLYSYSNFLLDAYFPNLDPNMEIYEMFSNGDIQKAIENFDYESAYNLYIGSSIGQEMSFEEFKRQMIEGFQNGTNIGTLLKGNRDSTLLFEQVMHLVDPNFYWLPNPQRGEVTSTHNSQVDALLGGENQALGIFNSGDIGAAIGNFDFQAAYDVYKNAPGAQDIGFEEFRQAIIDGFQRGQNVGTTLRGDPNSTDVFEKTMGLLDPNFEWTPNPAAGTVQITNRTRAYVPIFTVGLDQFATGVIESATITVGETIGEQTTTTYLLDEGNQRITLDNVSDTVKRNIYAQLQANLSENFSLLAGAGPGATYGARLGTPIGENFYGSASILLD